MVNLIINLIILLVVFSHAWYIMGRRAAINFALVGWVVAYIFEDLGVRTGLIFGRYYFTPMMGPKLDVLPIAVPCIWTLIAYIGWSLTNLLLDKSPFTKTFTVGRVLLGATLGALLMAATDVNADPLSVHNHMWVWVDGGSYFGVPIHNYVGWFFVSFITLLIHSWLTYHFMDQQTLTLSTAQRRWTIFPLIMWLLCAVAFIMVNYSHILAYNTP